MARSIKVNFVFNVLNTVMGLLFPLITFPYASRVLLAEGIGQVNYFISIISYVVLITGLGIPIYGIREVARVRDDIKRLTQTTVEILSLNLLLNVIGYIAIAVMCLTLDQISGNISLFLILSLTVVLTTIGCGWFYSGIEDFKAITLRSLLVRSLSLFILFGFVRTKEDLLFYGVFYLFASVGSNVINFALLRKHLNFSLIKIHDLNLFKHIKPALAVFIFSVVSSIYLNLDKVMLGAIKDTTSVGYYTAASQLSHILLTLVISLGTVLLPRSSNLIKNNQMEEFYKLSEKSYRFILMTAIPIVAGCIIMSPSLIRMFCGPSYMPSIQTLCLIAPIILIIGMSQAIGMQILYPLGKIELVTYSTCAGAIVNLLLNFFLIPLYSQDGAAISSVAAECSVTLTLVILAKRFIPFKLFSSYFFVYIVAALIMMAICSFVTKLCGESDIKQLLVVPLIGAGMYSLLLLIIKDSMFLEFISTARNSLRKIIG